MNFLFQAIQKATGSIPETPEVETDTPALQTITAEEAQAYSKLDSILSGAVKIEKTPAQSPVIAVPGAAPAAATAPKTAFQKLRFEVQHPRPGIVAVMAHPVIPQNLAAMEQTKVLRHRVLEVMRARKIKSLMITSSMPAEGKTLTAVNLAFSLSHQGGKRVLLIDADLRRPTIASVIGMSNKESGLERYLRGEATLREICWQLGPNVDVIPTLPLKNSTEYLHEGRMQPLLAEAAEQYDVILLDSPPLFPIADAQVIATMVDAAVLVVRAGVTRFEMAKEAARILHGKVIGTVLNGVDRLPNHRYYNSYYIGQER